MPKPTLHLRVLSPKETLYEGDVLSVSSTNSQGKFDILPQHANFVTMVKDSPVVALTPDEQKITFNLSLAIMYTTTNVISVYTDIVLEGKTDNQP